MNFVKQVLSYDVGEPWILVSGRFVEPLEGLVGISAEGIDLRNVIRPVLLESGDQCSERDPRLRLASERTIHHWQADQPGRFIILLLNFSQRGRGIVLEQHGNADLIMRAGVTRAQTEDAAVGYDRG